MTHAWDSDGATPYRRAEEFFMDTEPKRPVPDKLVLLPMWPKPWAYLKARLRRTDAQ